MTRHEANPVCLATGETIPGHRRGKCDDCLRIHRRNAARRNARLLAALKRGDEVTTDLEFTRAIQAAIAVLQRRPEVARYAATRAAIKDLVDAARLTRGRPRAATLAESRNIA